MAIIFLAVVVRFPPAPTSIGGDTWNYLAAGERLNAGHGLYALSPGDRDVLLAPPYWSVPLLSPPFVAVVWRPLALLGDTGIWLWWSAGLLASTGLVVWILARGTAGELLGLIALSPVLWMTAFSGNAMAILVPLLATRHPAAVAAAGGVKLAPGLLALQTGVPRALAWGLVVAGVSVLGAGIDNHLAWLASVPASAPSPVSLSGLTGAPYWLVFLGCVLLATRGWRTAVVAATFASPVVYFPTLSLLLLAVAPATKPHHVARSNRDADPANLSRRE